MGHDIVTIGASAGGIEVLLELVHELPATLDASLFIAVHMPGTWSSDLPAILSRRGPLKAVHPLHGDVIERQRIYVAPPDMHLQVGGGRIEVVRGPKDNGFRPSVDVLFRTAAGAFGPRVIGVVLSGYQDCGTAGMMSIKAHGGVAVVQDPKTAVAPDMPRNVMEKVNVDHVVHPLELPLLLTRLVATPEGPPLTPALAIQQFDGLTVGSPSAVVCPICEGVLTEAQPGVFTHFRCHVGHAFSLETLVHEQSEEMERTLWAAVRALEESATLSHRLSLAEKGQLRERFAEKAATLRRQADYIRHMLLHAETLTPLDAKLVP